MQKIMKVIKKGDPTKKAMTYYIDIDTIERLEKFCKQENKVRSGVVSAAIDEYIRKYTKFKSLNCDRK